MSTTVFERISSLLAAIAWLLALVVGWLGLLWWLQGEPAEKLDRPLPPVRNAALEASKVEREFSPVPAVETVAMQSTSVQDWVELAVRGAVRVAAEPGFEDGDGDSAGARQGRRAGPNVTGDPAGELGASRAERWEIVIAASSLQEYAGRLDQLGIELGAVGRRPGVDYVRRLAGKPLVRHGPSEDEHRLYFSWTSPSPLVKWEQELLTRSGIDHKDRLILRFVPPELEAEMARLELDYAKEKGHSSVTEIAKTVFESKAAGSGYDFVVVEQRYRRK